MRFRKFIKQRTSPPLLGVYATSLTFLFTLVRGVQHLGLSDAHDYVNEASGMLNGWSYMASNPNLFGHGFGFTFLIATTFFVTGSSSLLILKLFLAIAHGCSTFLVARIGILIGLEKKYWTTAALFFLIDPFILLAATDIQTESLTTLIVLYWCYLYLAPFKNLTQSKRNVLLFSLSGFYSVIMRPNSLLPFVFIAFAIFLKWRKEEIHTLVLAGSTLLFIFLIGVFEVFLSRLYSGFVFLSPVGGTNAEFMCRTEFIPQYLGFASSAKNAQINSIVSTSQSAEFLLQNPSLSIPQLNHELVSVGVHTCLSHPFQSVGIMILKVFALWRPFTVLGAYGLKVMIFTFLLWLPLTATTVWFLLRNNLAIAASKLKIYFILMSAGFTLSLLLTPTQIRHRVAFAEPFYWIFGLFFVQACAIKYANRQKLT